MVLQPILRTPDSSNRRSLRSNTPAVTFDLSPASSDSEQQVYFDNEPESDDSETTEEEPVPASQAEEEEESDSDQPASQELEACPICNLQFSTKHATQNHVRRQHNNVTANTWNTQHRQWLLDNRLTTCTHCSRPYARAYVSEHARTCTSRSPDATSDEQLSVRTPAAAQPVAAAASSAAGSSGRQPAVTGASTSRTPQGVAAILRAPQPEPDFRSYALWVSDEVKTFITSVDADQLDFCKCRTYRYLHKSAVADFKRVHDLVLKAWISREPT
jgi:hypothetical protein